MTTPQDVSDEALAREIEHLERCDGEFFETSAVYLSDAIALLRQAVSDRAELARLKGQTCATCKFAVAGEGVTYCTQPDMRYLNDVEGLGHVTEVPLEVNGQPFGCAGWEAKEPKP